MKRYKVLLSLCCVVVFVFLAVGSTGNDEESAAEPEEEVTAVEEAETEPAYDIETYEQMVLEILEENYEGLAIIELDSEDKTFFITPDEVVIPDLLAIQSGDPEAVQAWNEAVDAFIFFSNTMKDMLPGYALALRNPANPELILLAVLDGLVIYEFTND